MKVKLNDRTVELPDGSTLAQLLDGEGMSQQRIATAVNGNVVKATDRDTYSLAEGDSIIVIKAFYGG